MFQELLVNKGDNLFELNDKIRQMLYHYPSLKIVVEPIYQKRTTKQNGLYQVYLKRIAEFAGFSCNPNGKEYLELYIRDLAISKGYPPLYDSNGEIVTETINYLGRNYKFSKTIHGADATEAQFKILIDTCKDVALDYGYLLDDNKTNS